MPDLPNRTDEEAALAAELYLLFAQHEAEAIELLGGSTDVGRLAPAFWQAMQQRIEDGLAELLGRIHQQAAQRMAAELRLTGDPAAEVANAFSWATERAYQLSLDLVTRIQQAVAAEVSALSAAEAVAIGSVLAVQFAPERAGRIAATEITNAVSAGEFDQRDALEERYGLTIVAIWNTRDGDACPVCRRMNRMTEREFSRYYPSGPGNEVHPACRCFLTWEIV